MLPLPFASRKGGCEVNSTTVDIDDNSTTKINNDNKHQNNNQQWQHEKVATAAASSATAVSSATPTASVNANSCDSQKSAELFPYLLHGMLEDAEKNGQTSIVSWTVDGRSFRIHEPAQFVIIFVGQYFGGSIEIGNDQNGDRLTEFRSHLKDWGFDNPNSMDNNVFFHPCFSKGDPSLCRYMRCSGNTKNEVSMTNTSASSMDTNTCQTQLVHSNLMPVNAANGINSKGVGTNNPTKGMNYEKTAAAAAAATKMLLEQQIQQEKQRQQQQREQQSPAFKLQNLLSSNNMTSDQAITALLFNQLLASYQQNPNQQQQQISPEVLAALAQGLQRSQPIVSTVGNVVNPMSINLLTKPEHINSASIVSRNGVMAQQPAVNSFVGSTASVVSGGGVMAQQPQPVVNSSVSTSARGLNSNTSCIPTSANKPMTTVPCAPRMVNNYNKNTLQVKPSSASTSRYNQPMASVKTTATATSPTCNTSTPTRPSVSAKRAAFLNKRSKATGAAYRNPNKKQKRATNGGRKINLLAKSALSSYRNGVTTSSFTLNENLKEKALATIDLLLPWKLHDMLDDAETNLELKNIVSWQPDGVSFSINNEDRFVSEVVPRYFTKSPIGMNAFTKILSSWGFVRFASGPQSGAFIHRLLVKGKRPVCKQMRVNGKTVSDWMKRHCQFLGRLHAMLRHAEKEGNTSIVSWTMDGKKFRINDPSAFMNTVFSTYFDSMTYSSFEQKLRRWGFMRSPANHQKIDKNTTKVEIATYSHPCFVKVKVPNLMWIKSDNSVPRTLRPLHTFLFRLRVMLTDSSRHGLQFVISWCSHGKAFMIHDRPYFSNNIMPHYFKSKFTSFRQSLRNHGFAQIGGNGWDEGAYYHKLFLRDEPLLSQGLTQDQFKKTMPEWLPVEDEPRFHPKDNHESVVAAAAMVSLKASPSNQRDRSS